jgi:hypothetical protein
MIYRFAVGLALAALAAYGIFEAYPLIAGPAITLHSPKEGEALPSALVAIVGTVYRTTKLTLNGSMVLPNIEGKFKETLAFPPGTSILELTASDRFSRTVRIIRTIYIPAHEQPINN